MRVAILTREYPPEVYGGAGVHVDFLVEALRAHGRHPGQPPDRDAVEVDVQCMGRPREGATAHAEGEERLAGANPALGVLSADLSMVAALGRGAPRAAGAARPSDG